MTQIKDVATDRLRYTKNSISAVFSYIAIALNALYFISIYSTDVGSYFYNYEIGISVIYNLLFMLFVFLASEGVKSYDYKFSLVLILIGALQIVRIFGIPLTAYQTVVQVGMKKVQAMEIGQFIWCIVLLSLSAGMAIAGGIIGLVKTKKLRSYEKSLGLH